MYAGDDLDEPDNMWVYAAHGGEAQYVEGVLQGIVAVDPACIGRSGCKGGLSRRAKEGRDKMARSQREKKHFNKREDLIPTVNLPW